ncbi:MAG: cbb3-type cytochrome c oxidase N-terminal domain-containing protein [Ignavibacteria bacterium]|nr:cbb3-type cytochrome c oxidase N-terminal domain-containing protein [Ignavibacteria bacterium]
MKLTIQNKQNQFMKMALLFFFSASVTFGQAQEMDMTAYIDNAAILFFLLVLVIFVVLFLNLDKKGNEWGLALKAAFRQLSNKLIDAAPIEKEEDILLEHDYDGIKELDNNLPPWWKYLFYATIIFAIVYMLDYHIIGSGKLQEAEYLEEVKLAELEKANMFGGKLVDENTAQVLTEPADLLAGQTTFNKLCSACHGTKGEGLVGPNLTDDYWIHGGGIKNVFLIIKDGVLDKGMISWKNQLTPAQMEEVGSYILSLRGTNPPNAKPPQGDLWSEKPDSLKVQ